MKKLVLAFMMGAAAMAANAQVNYKVQTACHPQDVKHYDTELLRSRFMMDKVMAPDEINVTYTLYDIVNQLIVKDVLERVKDGGTNQLQMGLTELAPGSVWNTMPAHTHTRRMEAYYYFNLKPGNAICHLMGEPQEERLIWLHNEQAITSPEWSIHAAAGTSNYTFIWGMGGENLKYSDKDEIKYIDMK